MHNETGAFGEGAAARLARLIDKGAFENRVQLGAALERQSW